jgi:8-oxo-dGTP pyrophosphatase MutT (NUDIX family)
MGQEPDEELLNVYDGAGRVVGARRRTEAKASGLAVGAVNALVVDRRGQVLLQHRPPDKENGGRWDKTVGGHVGAGEEFDDTMRREAGEELFDDPTAARVRLAADAREYERLLAEADLSREVVLRQAGLQLNLRDVRFLPGTGARTVLYHVAIYLGTTDLPASGFSPQASEVAELRYFPAAEVDRMLLEGRLSPNMAFLWLTQAHALFGGDAARRH